MNNSMKRGLSLLLALVLCFSLAASVGAAGSIQYYELVLEDTAEYLKSMVKEPAFGSVGGEWVVLGLARSGITVPDSYYQGYYKNLCKTLQDTGGTLDARLNTEFCRVIVALAAMGTDARDVEGYDLTLPLGDYTQTLSQGLNGPIWALIALDSRNYPVPTAPAGKVQATRELYIGHKSV